jgi:Ala-tRNA(Pro) deacylase
MALSERLRKLLERNNIQYEVLPHREAFTSQEVANTSHVAGRLLAKPVIVRESEDRWYMAVVPATEHVSLAAVHRVTGRARGRLATEEELRRLFPDCELGAMPPIGALYGIPSYLDEGLRRNEDIYFQAGNHHEIVRMKFADYERLAGPFLGEFTLHREPAKVGG